MQRKITFLSLLAISVIAGTAGASAQTYDRFDNRAGWSSWSDDAYDTAPPPAAYPPQAYYARPYESINGAHHPAPSSTQGDVGPEGNNNGTRSGVYRW